jgi:hypothetical protein
MKLVNYQLQTQIENLSELKSKDYFKDYLNRVIEDESKPYYQRADYIGLSLNELKNKIDYLASDISELQQYKKKLSSALDIAKQITADVLINNGIDRIDGNIISSLTLSKSSNKVKNTITITDEQEVMKLGYVKFEPDTEAIEKAMTTKEGLTELSPYVSITSNTITTPSKVKINTKRTSINTQADELLSIEEQAA